MLGKAITNLSVLFCLPGLSGYLLVCMCGPRFLRYKSAYLFYVVDMVFASQMLGSVHGHPPAFACLSSGVFPMSLGICPPFPLTCFALLAYATSEE